MKEYTLLVFSWDDEVVTTATVHEVTGDDESVRELAERLLSAFPNAAGYQVWSGGQRVFSTFPLESTLSLARAQK